MKIWFPQFYERDSTFIQREFAYRSFDDAAQAGINDEDMCDWLGTTHPATVDNIYKHDDGSGTVYVRYKDSGKRNNYTYLEIVCMTVADE